MQPVDLLNTYSFLKRLVTPFEKWDAHRLGIIDAKGNQLKLRKNLQTQQERAAFGYFDILAVNLKKLLAKVPGGQTQLGTYAAAALLMKERPISESDEFEDFEQHIAESLQCLSLEEDAPTVNAGGGAVAGIGVGAQGEPGVNKKRKDLANVVVATLRRAPPQ